MIIAVVLCSLQEECGNLFSWEAFFSVIIKYFVVEFKSIYHNLTELVEAGDDTE